MPPPYDHYETLGVSPLADDVVIKAAYRALAQKFHPDRNASVDAAARMQQINAAYEVLSDPARRRAYDEELQRSKPNAGLSEEGENAEDAHTIFEELFGEPWKIAVEYYPELEALRAKLTRLSAGLGEVFRFALLESKRFEDARDIAARLEEHFLQRYFGLDSKITAFARELIELRARDAALELNQTVNALGACLPAERVISKLERKFDINARRIDYQNSIVKEHRRADLRLLLAALQSDDTFETAGRIIVRLGGTWEYVPIKKGMFGVFGERRLVCSVLGKTYEFKSFPEAVKWARTELWTLLKD